MNLFLLRHASAGTKRANPVLDIKRPLDKDGKRHCLLLGHALTAMKVQFDVVIASPLKRAVQTAALVGTETGYEQRIIFSEALAPNASYAAFEKLLSMYSKMENVLVVGHDPTLSAFAGKLIASGKNARAAHVRLRKGSIARITLEKGKTELNWLMDPRMIKAFYASYTSSTKSSRRKTSRK